MGGVNLEVNKQRKRRWNLLFEILEEMVKLHIKRGDESVMLYEATVQTPIKELITQLVKLHNGILKVQRLCQGKNLCNFLDMSMVRIAVCFSS